MIRRLLAVVWMVGAASAGVFVGGVPAGATSCPLTLTCVDTFYSSSTFTTVVGQRGFECGVHPFQWGTVTAFRIYSEFDC